MKIFKDGEPADVTYIPDEVLDAEPQTYTDSLPYYGEPTPGPYVPEITISGIWTGESEPPDPDKEVTIGKADQFVFFSVETSSPVGSETVIDCSATMNKGTVYSAVLVIPRGQRQVTGSVTVPSRVRKEGMQSDLSFTLTCNGQTIKPSPFVVHCE